MAKKKPKGEGADDSLEKEADKKAGKGGVELEPIKKKKSK